MDKIIEKVIGDKKGRVLVSVLGVIIVMVGCLAMYSAFYTVPDDTLDMTYRPSEMSILDKMQMVAMNLMPMQFDAQYGVLEDYKNVEFGLNVPFGINSAWKTHSCDLGGKDSGRFAFYWSLDAYSDYSILDVDGGALPYKSIMEEGDYIWWIGMDSNYLQTANGMYKYWTYSSSAVDHNNSRCFVDAIAYQYSRCPIQDWDVETTYGVLGLQPDRFYEDWHTFLAPYLCMFSIQNGKIGIYVLRDDHARYSRASPEEVIREYGTFIPLSFDNGEDNLGNAHNDRVWIRASVDVYNETIGNYLCDSRNVIIHCSCTQEAFEEYLKDPTKIPDEPISDNGCYVNMYCSENSVEVGSKITVQMKAFTDTSQAMPFNSSTDVVRLMYAPPSGVWKEMKDFSLTTTHIHSYDFTLLDKGAHLFKAEIVDADGNILDTSAVVKVVVYEGSEEPKPPPNGGGNGTSATDILAYAIVIGFIGGLAFVVYRKYRSVKEGE